MTIRKCVLIMGCTGAIGHVLLKKISLRSDLDVYGTARESEKLSEWFAPELVKRIYSNIDVHNIDSVLSVMNEIQPSTIINCIGIIKQILTGSDSIEAITINSLWPHRLAMLCKLRGVKMIHFSTDCVFSGNKGNYNESVIPDPVDLYGRSKCLGEVEYPHCVTLRKSIIGHELKGGYGLLEWFLSQEGRVRGFTNAMYSGITAHELVRVIVDYVLPNEGLRGIYHVSSSVISKYDLLHLIAKRYGKVIEIESCDDVRLDRSLDSDKFKDATGYRTPSWQEMIDQMYDDYEASSV